MQMFLLKKIIPLKNTAVYLTYIRMKLIHAVGSFKLMHSCNHYFVISRVFQNSMHISANTSAPFIIIWSSSNLDTKQTLLKPKQK